MVASGTGTRIVPMPVCQGQMLSSDTVKRDLHNSIELERMGWRVITVWECELNNNAESIVKDITQQIKTNL